MGTNYKAALIPHRIRETIHGWGKAARRKRRLGMFTDDSTIHTDTSTVMSVEEDDNRLFDTPETVHRGCMEIEIPPASHITLDPSPVANETSSRAGTPLLRPSASVSASVALHLHPEGTLRSSSNTLRSSSMPISREWKKNDPPMKKIVIEEKDIVTYNTSF